MGAMPKASLTTLGCKLNAAETAAIGQQFLERGYTLVEFGDPSDVAVINTCSVTARADRECRQLIRRALRARPSPVVIVTGCYAQLEPDEVASIGGVDFVLGTREKFDLFTHVGLPVKQARPQVRVSDIQEADDFGPAFSTLAGDQTRAFLKVQDGCDFSCSFCTIPLARGSSRSQSVDACLEQARALSVKGFREIVLTGVNVGDYGRKIGADLLRLLEALVQVEGLDRIRISSIEPNLLTDEIIEFVAAHKNMCKHFHVPLQSGSDAVLCLMRRRYTTRQYAERIARIRARIPECGIGADVIVGFPGEGEGEFAQTVEFLTSQPLTYLHVFTFSERPGTPASLLEGAVEPSCRFRRNEVLRLLGRKKKEAFYRQMVGKTLPVLFESDDESGCRCGFTDNYVRVEIPSHVASENSIVGVAITGVKEDRCVGEVRSERRA